MSLCPSPPPPHLLFEKNPFPFVFTTKLQVLRRNLSFKHSRCWKFIRRKRTSSGSCMIVVDNIFCPSRRSHFVGLSSSPTLIVHPMGKVFFLSNALITWWHYMSRAGSICRELGTLYPHGSLIVMWSSFVIYIFPWSHTDPDIPMYRERSRWCPQLPSKKPISTFYRAFAFSFDHFFLLCLCLNLPISFLNGDCATFFT